MLARCFFQSCFQSIEDETQEFLRVFLFSCVCRLTVELLERKAELHGVELCALGELQVSNQFLHLVHHVIIHLFALVVFQVFWLPVVNAEQVVAEGRDHEELLHHAVHVADAAQIAQADVLLVALRLDLRNVVPSLGLLDGRDERRQMLV